jgi:hypothetical protein
MTLVLKSGFVFWVFKKKLERIHGSKECYETITNKVLKIFLTGNSIILYVICMESR